MSFDESLIELVKNQQFLYNSGCSGFRNRELKEAMWKNIAETLNESEKYCITRWKGLRDRFGREHKEIKVKALSGENHKSEWEHYKALMFLSDFHKPRYTPSYPANLSANTVSITKPEYYNSESSGNSTFFLRITFEEQLIELVKNEEFLYNNKCCAYKDLDIKNAAWKRIAENLNETEANCIRRWKSLRDRFGRELKDERSNPSGNDPNAKLRWEHFESLMFLAEFYRPRKKISTVCKNNVSESESEEIAEEFTYYTEDNMITEDSYYDSDPIHTSIHTPRKRKIPEVEAVGTEIVNCMSTLKKFLSNEDSGEQKPSFWKRADALLSGLNTNNREVAEKKIMKFLCQVQLKELENENVDTVFI